MDKLIEELQRLLKDAWYDDGTMCVNGDTLAEILRNALVAQQPVSKIPTVGEWDTPSEPIAVRFAGYLQQHYEFCETGGVMQLKGGVQTDIATIYKLWCERKGIEQPVSLKWLKIDPDNLPVIASVCWYYGQLYLVEAGNLIYDEDLSADIGDPEYAIWALTGDKGEKSIVTHYIPVQSLLTLNKEK